MPERITFFLLHENTAQHMQKFSDFKKEISNPFHTISAGAGKINHSHLNTRNPMSPLNKPYLPPNHSKTDKREKRKANKEKKKGLRCVLAIC